MISEILWNSEELSEALDVQIAFSIAAMGVSIDSRKINPGDIFIALKGENFNGHDFVRDALQKGAAAAIVSEDVPGATQTVKVRDTFDALIAMATHRRKRMRGKIIGVTGSVGKTGTKEALRLVLSRQGRTYATDGNLNNHIGVPLTLARMPASTQFAIIEMGMNKPGEIAPLSKLCQPYVGIITAISPAHIEFFDSLAGIADEKADIVAGMGAESIAIFNRDTPNYDRMVKKAEARKIGRIIGFGADPMAQARLLNCNLQSAYSDVDADILGQKISYRIGSPGRHLVLNSLAVLSAVHAIGADIHKAAADLNDLKPPAGRGQRFFVDIPGGRIEVIDESYNANPDSMRAAIDVLARAETAPSGRRVAVIGDMLELGPDAARMHADLADALRAANLDFVFCCGPHSQHLYDAVANYIDAEHAPNADALAPLVARAAQPGDIFMVKGSYGSKMRVVIEALNRLNYQPHQQQTMSYQPVP